MSTPVGGSGDFRKRAVERPWPVLPERNTDSDNRNVLGSEAFFTQLLQRPYNDQRMQASRIAELLDPFLGPPDGRRLPPSAFELISTYIDILQRWNARINLTAIRDEEEIVVRHFGESLFAARHLFPGGGWGGHGLSGADSALAVADIGSGAGFPGVPIRLWAPEISLTLIESNHKKATFLRELTRALTLTDVKIQNTRAEFLAHTSFGVVTLRAVERFQAILPVAARLLAPQGRLALLIGRAQLPQARSALPSLNWSVLPVPASESRVLAVAVNPEC